MRINCFRLVSMALTLTLTLSFMTPFTMAYDSSDIEKDVLEKVVYSVEQEFDANGTSIIQELQRMITFYESVAANEDDPARVSKIQDLIEATEHLLTRCEQSITGNPSTRGTPAAESKYALAIAAIVSWFSANGYHLAAELLMHADDNNDPNSTYTPCFGDSVNNSSVTRNIRKSIASKGSDLFPSNQNKDLYYAIHCFNWKKTSSHLVITDRYDYELGDPSYSNLAGQAVNAMALAQRERAIVPYTVEIYTFL